MIEIVREVPRSPLAGFFVKAAEKPGATSLAIGDIYQPIAPAIKQAVRTALDEDFTHYTPQTGIKEARMMAAVDFNRDGIPATSNNTIVSSGSTPILPFLFFSLCGQGVDILIPEPAYPAYLDFTQAWGGNPILIDTEPDGFMLTRKACERALEQAIHRSSILIITSPNNPTGMVWDMKEIADLPVDTFIVDEAYCGLVYEGEYTSLASFPEASGRVFTIRSCSKTYTMSGLRVGYMTGPEEVMDKAPSYFERFVGSTCSLSLRAAVAALKQPREAIRPLVEELDVKRRYVLEWLTKLGIPYPRPCGALYVWADFLRYGLGSVELAESILAHAKVAITPGIAFGARYDGYLRFSYATVSMEQLEEALGKVTHYLRTL